MAADPLMIVGLGASAGGIQAFKQFFERVRVDSGMTYVAILHLSPEHESHLSDVLQTSAVIPVTTVEDRVKVEPNHVYVVSPRQSLAMSDGWLVQSEATRPEERRAPIDIFFRTMAASHGADAVCIVLSGTGADGSMGLKRVKEEGGLCLVQDPGEAEYGDMPRNAVATGLTDAVLPASDMPARIVAYRDRRRLVHLSEKAEDRRGPDEKALHDVFSLIRERTGHDFSNYKRATVLRRVERRLGVREMASVAAYAEFLRDNPEETQALLKDLLISVTNFFRDPDAFAVLERDVIPKLFEQRGEDGQVRAWIAGCATGEEAYSIAMLLAEYASSVPESPGVQIFATDLDEQAIAVAREGLYTLNDAADVAPERLRRFFTKEGESFRVRKELREMVLFAHHNLVKDPPFSHLDLVSCRNLLIYLNRTAQQRVLDVLHFALDGSGYLFLGSSESVEGASEIFAPVNQEAHIYQRRGGHGKIAVPFQALTFGSVARPLANDPTASAGRERQPPSDLHLRLLEQYAPPSVVVNEDHDIVYLTERAGRFLHFAAGEPSTNLVKLVRPELRLELRAALYQAAQQRISVNTDVLAVTMADDRAAQVVIRVRPVLRHDDPARGFFLVLFEETPGPRTDAHPVQQVSAGEPVRQLEEEASRLKAQLRTTIEQYETQTEELKASNEELQAINEELRSATEELETSREELQSLNEELRTVNQELKVKIDEETQTSNDILNLINSTDFGTVFIDRAGRLKLFTPRARDLFALIPSDRGRPLTDISSELVGVDLSADIDRVLERLERVERDVTSRSGRAYLMRLGPYRTADDKIDGVVLTFVDITDLKAATARVLESESRMARAIEVESVGILFFGLDGVVTDANDAFLRLSGFSRETIRAGGLRWDMLATGDPHGQFSSGLQALRTSGHAPSYEIDCVRPDGTMWSAIFASRRLSSVEAVAFAVDITDRRRVSSAVVDSDRRRNEFLAALAHELRNPLAPIAAALDVMKLSTDGSRMEQARQVMERQVTHVIRLVEDLLELSRITLGKIDVRRDAVDLAAVLRTAVETCSTAIESARHSLIVAVAPGQLVVHGDAVRLTQVFTNLLSNAAKYTPHAGTIRLSAERMNGTAVVTVSDNGIGIPPHTLPYVFDLFTQGLQPSGGARSGLGIGLALVRTLVEAHGGTVEASSSGLHRGSTFVVRLPAIHPLAAQVVTAGHGTTDIAAHRIVVVDDNQDAANTLEALLTTLGADVRVAYGGADGITAVREHRPGVVFIDLGMPDTDGFAVARAIVGDPERTPVLVALTGWGQSDIRRRTSDAGFQHHLTKPASLEQLQAILATVPALPPDRN